MVQLLCKGRLLPSASQRSANDPLLSGCMREYLRKSLQSLHFGCSVYFNASRLFGTRCLLAYDRLGRRTEAQVCVDQTTTPALLTSIRTVSVYIHPSHQGSHCLTWAVILTRCFLSVEFFRTPTLEPLLL